MPLVFTEDWVNQLKHRYEKSGVVAPPVFRVATLEKWQPIRDEIERWVSLLPNTSQQKILLKLRSPNSFIQTYNELAIAGYLLQYAYELEYEKEIQGLTPDWFVKTQNKNEFIVEVFSRTVSNEEKSQQAQISELWERLKKIPIGVGIFLTYENLSNIPKLNSGLIKKMANEVGYWLEKETPKPNMVKTFYGISFEIKSYNSKWNHVVLAGPNSGAYVVNNEPMFSGIEEKVRKYQNLANDFKLSLVIAVVPSFETGLEKDDLEEVLFDRNLFLKRPLLSTVIGLWRNSMCDYQTAIYHNNNAQNPLAKEIFNQ